MEYYLMGDLSRAAKYHTRAMSNVLEAKGSPAKTDSALSVHRREEVEGLGEKYNHLLTREDQLIIRKTVREMRKKEIECVPVEETLRKGSKWNDRDLPTAQMAQRRLANSESLPVLNNKKRKQKEEKVLYSHLSMERTLDNNAKTNVFDKVLRESRKLRTKLYDDFFAL
eukprot:TRINITY_DN3841_c0_g3_i13.p3 TRINITY_DN3841_c0_g3~~TRINITY_DN3841_c0_g3_i13.p3  ORF type:complete len:169 (+),score=53.07 TRINITY_DN3841_c0_g3_i13:774-1280(+)